MNEYMNQTQNNPKYPMGNINMPGNTNMSVMPQMNTPMMPISNTKAAPKPSSLSAPVRNQADPMPFNMLPGESGSQPLGGQPTQLVPRPTQFETGPMQSAPAVPSMPSPPSQGIIPSRSRQGPPPVMNPEYIPGFLTSIIGRMVRAEFILGTAQYVDRAGILVDVGVNYFVLHDTTSNNYVMCDLYSVRFVTILN